MRHSWTGETQSTAGEGALGAVYSHCSPTIRNTLGDDLRESRCTLADAALMRTSRPTIHLLHSPTATPTSTITIAATATTAFCVHFTAAIATLSGGVRLGHVHGRSSGRSDATCQLGDVVELPTANWHGFFTYTRHTCFASTLEICSCMSFAVKLTLC